MSKHWNSGKVVRGRFGTSGVRRELDRRSAAALHRAARPAAGRRPLGRWLSARHAATLRPFLLLWIFAGTAGALGGLGAFDGAQPPVVMLAAGPNAGASSERGNAGPSTRTAGEHVTTAPSVGAPEELVTAERSDGAAVEDAATTTYPQVSRQATGADFSLCHAGGGDNCVVDGDTIRLAGSNIRLADIDAPETHEPRCAEEQALGNRATLRLQQLLNSGEVTLTPIDRDEDRYGRKLRIVEVNGVSVGNTLVGEGLARWYAGGRRSWC